MKILSNTSIKNYTTLHIGEDVDKIYFPETMQEVIFTMNTTSSFILGKGSNVLFSDRFHGEVMILTEYKKIRREGNTIIAESGALLKDVCLFALQEGLGGLENLFGIPGSVGGAIYMNAGAYGKEIKDVVSYVTYYDGCIETYKNQDCEFSYRHSIFNNKKGVILEVSFECEPKNQESIRSFMMELWERRKQSQPLDQYSAGSTFKRGKDFYASALINDCNLKGYRVNDASVSTKHAGFLINEGNATYQDYIQLIKEVQNIVYEKTQKQLECEIRIIE